MSGPPPGVAEAGAAIAARVAGFTAHLRLNGLSVGPAETGAVLDWLARGEWRSAAEVRHALRCLLTGSHEEWRRFDDLFEAFWLGRGRMRAGGAAKARPRGPSRTTRRLWSERIGGEGAPGDADAALEMHAGDEGGGSAAHAVTARLAASRAESLRRVDLRHVADPEQSARAERIALRLARAMRHRISRRWRAHGHGERLDLRRTIRRSLARGGDPMDLVRERRRDRPVRVVAMLDVSGSMQPYSRFLLQFVKGLARSWPESDVFAFHTRLLRVTEVLRERDALLAMSRLTLMAGGFGGGTRMSDCLAEFNRHHARRALDSRSVFLMLSDGYDTGEAQSFVTELQRLKRRVRRVVWLNPLLGQAQYRPLTRTMQAALPYVDCFAPAHSLEALAGVERELEAL